MSREHHHGWIASGFLLVRGSIFKVFMALVVLGLFVVWATTENFSNLPRKILRGFVVVLTGLVFCCAVFVA